MSREAGEKDISCSGSGKEGQKREGETTRGARARRMKATPGMVKEGYKEVSGQKLYLFRSSLNDFESAMYQQKAGTILVYVGGVKVRLVNLVGETE